MNQASDHDSPMEALRTRGWAVLPGVIETNFLQVLSHELEKALKVREAIRARNRVEGNNDGTLHHLLADHPCFLELLGRFAPFDAVLREYFSGNYILNSFGGVINRADTSAYVHAVHRDIRFSSNARRFMLNALVMLDAFTPENGATHILSGSQEEPVKPDLEDFIRRSDRACGPAGSILFFDSRLWHAAGRNQQTEARRALTLTFTSPFFKQQLDYPRLLGYQRMTSLTPFLRQVIGFNARVPASLDEYYVPVAQRFYQRGQDD